VPGITLNTYTLIYLNSVAILGGKYHYLAEKATEAQSEPGFEPCFALKPTLLMVRL
jgi:hypothetical protein